MFSNSIRTIQCVLQKTVASGWFLFDDEHADFVCPVFTFCGWIVISKYLNIYNVKFKALSILEMRVVTLILIPAVIVSQYRLQQKHLNVKYFFELLLFAVSNYNSSKKLTVFEHFSTCQNDSLTDVSDWAIIIF